MPCTAVLMSLTNRYKQTVLNRHFFNTSACITIELLSIMINSFTTLIAGAVAIVGLLLGWSAWLSGRTPVSGQRFFRRSALDP